ncbi:hypothetical protein AAFF_G00092930 [Aldrovandia affinis]|uniref:Uncharacterized protein n=1 Tax=Aldrovandia affinis TaxID=143900 RepID=A0AAD7T2P4_9TELE|nr:hypothetical protein AAFF_G00092930 [Aldrovandia affinis]
MGQIVNNVLRPVPQGSAAQRRAPSALLRSQLLSGAAGPRHSPLRSPFPMPSRRRESARREKSQTGATASACSPDDNDGRRRYGGDDLRRWTVLISARVKRQRLQLKDVTGESNMHLSLMKSNAQIANLKCVGGDAPYKGLAIAARTRETLRWNLSPAALRGASYKAACHCAHCNSAERYADLYTHWTDREHSWDCLMELFLGSRIKSASPA